jgi:hypothetical protein
MLLAGLRDLMNPRAASKFFRRIHPRSLEANVRYVAILGISVFLGQFLLYGVFGINLSIGGGGITFSETALYPLDYSLWMALGSYLIKISEPLLIGLGMAVLGLWLAGRAVPLSEGVTIACYAYTPALLLGVFSAFFAVGTVVWIIGMMYSTLLLFIGARASFDKPNSGFYALSVQWVVVIFLMPILFIPWNLLTGALFGGVEPASEIAISGAKGTIGIGSKGPITFKP